MNAAYERRRSEGRTRKNVNHLLEIGNWRLMADRREDCRRKLEEARD